MTDTFETGGFDEELDNPRIDLHWGIADQLKILFDQAVTPSEFEPPAVYYTPDERNFDSDEWMESLCAIQGWLRLSDDLTLTSPGQFLRTLAKGLEYDPPEQAIETFAGSERLTLEALDRLKARVERASQLLSVFVEALEVEDSSEGTATQRWREAWEEEEETEDFEQVSDPAPIEAKADTWPIQDFVARAEQGRLNLSPSWQRSDVWPTKDAQLLMESILRGIPLPSIIVMKPKNLFDEPFEVVDGKQRLTSILRFVGMHPRALERVREFDADHPGKGYAELFRKDYPGFRKAWKNENGEVLSAGLEAKYYFPYKLRSDSKALPGKLTPLRGKYYTQIRELPVEVAGERVPVSAIFESAGEYKVPVIQYSKATQRQIHEVFNLYNRQGKHLNAEEIRNAIYHDLELTRAVLVSAGDGPEDTPPSAIATCLSGLEADVDDISMMLLDYGFGVSRYRRAKVLSWIIAVLLKDSDSLLSTARQIDALFDRVQANQGDPLRKEHTLRQLFEFLARALRAHATVDSAWDPGFRDPKGNSAKWQELQLVGSVTGVAIASAVLGDEIEDQLRAHGPALRAASRFSWVRPSKTQTTQQWEYIARIARGVLQILGVDPTAASESLEEMFGSSGVPTLLRIPIHPPVPEVV